MAHSTITDSVVFGAGRSFMRQSPMVLLLLVMMMMMMCGLSACRIEERSVEEDHSPQYSYLTRLSCGNLSHQYFYMDEGRRTLYVGGRGLLVRVNMDKISETDCTTHGLPMKFTKCEKGTHWGDCTSPPMIRTIQPIGDGSLLYVCFRSPTLVESVILHANMTRADSFPLTDTLLGCGRHENSTALWVSSASGDKMAALYSGVPQGVSSGGPLLLRSNLYHMTGGGRLEHRQDTFLTMPSQESYWMDEPNFVAMLDIGEHVYIFFRENSIEFLNATKSIYSRVARICKNEKRGSGYWSSNFATFTKARLVCSWSGDSQLHFDEIQSVYQIPGDDSHFYAVFTTPMSPLMGSAICKYSLQDIENVFSGKYWQKIPQQFSFESVQINKNLADVRNCVKDRETLNTIDQSTAGKALLATNIVTPVGGKAVFYLAGVVLTHLVVNVVASTNGARYDGDYGQQSYNIYFASSNTGWIYKVVEWREGKVWKSHLADIINVAHPTPVRQMEMSRLLGYMYVASDDQIQQWSVAGMCAERYDTCVKCVRDPYCGWHRDQQRCRPHQRGLLQDVSGSTTTALCSAEGGVASGGADGGAGGGGVRHHSHTVSCKETLHLSCNAQLPIVVHRRVDTASSDQWRRQRARRRQQQEQEEEQVSVEQAPLDWWFQSEDGAEISVVEPDSTARLLTRNNGLVVLSVGESDAGIYEARYGPHAICRHTVHVLPAECAAPPPSSRTEYELVYRQWCGKQIRLEQQLKRVLDQQTQCKSVV